MAFALACATASVRAEAGPSARLVYLRGSGADTCPDERALRSAVAARLGYDPFFPWAPSTVFAEITRAGGAWRVSMKLVDDENHLKGARDLRVSGGDCAAAIDAMALSISLAIDPSSLDGPRPPSASDPPPPPPPPSPPVDAPPTPPAPADPPAEAPRVDTPVTEPSTPRSNDVLHPEAGLGVLGALGTAPGPAVGARVFAGARDGWLSLSLEGRADLSGRETTGSGVPVSSSLLLGSLVPCGHLGSVFACVVASVGSLHATSGATVPETHDALFVGVGPRVGMDVPVGGAFSLQVHADFLVVLTQTALDVDGAQVFRYAPVAGDAGVALAVRFR